jgi:hypothetical protein
LPSRLIIRGLREKNIVIRNWEKRRAVWKCKCERSAVEEVKTPRNACVEGEGRESKAEKNQNKMEAKIGGGV